MKIFEKIANVFFVSVGVLFCVIVIDYLINPVPKSKYTYTLKIEGDTTITWAEVTTKIQVGDKRPLFMTQPVQSSVWTVHKPVPTQMIWKYSWDSLEVFRRSDLGIFLEKLAEDRGDKFSYKKVTIISRIKQD